MLGRAIIVGAGIIGAATAYRLAQAGWSVVLLEGTRPAAGTSSRSFAWVNAQQKLPRPYHDLNAAGLLEHHRLTHELGDTGSSLCGNLVWETEPAARAALQARLARLRQWGYTVQPLSAAAAAACQPGLRLPADDTAEYLFAPAEGWVAVPHLIGRLLTAAERAGATLVTSARVDYLLVAGDRVQGVVAGDRSWNADLVIDCQGVTAGTLLTPLGWVIPRQHSPGLLVVTEPAPTPLIRVVHAPGVHLRPDGGGRVIIGSTAVDEHLTDLAAGTLRLDPTTALPQAVLERARAVLPALDRVEIEVARIGWRPLPADGLSAVGPLPGLEGYYLAFTHSGVTLGPLLGRLIAGEVTTGRPAPLLAPFRPARLVQPISDR